MVNESKPMTTIDLFCKICEMLEAKELIPDIVSQKIAVANPVEIYPSEHELRGDFYYNRYGGIHLKICIERRVNDEVKRDVLGTFVTYSNSREDMYAMAKFL